LKFCKKSRSL